MVNDRIARCRLLCKRKKVAGSLQKRRAMLVTKHMLFAEHIVELIDVNGEMFVHARILNHVFLNCKGFGELC